MEERSLESPRRTGWCIQRTQLEAALIFISLISTGVAVALVIVLALRTDEGSILTVQPSSLHPRPDQICFTSDCTRGAVRLMEGMNDKINPCDDFFEYACGQWNKKNSIPTGQSRYSTFVKLREELQVILKELLEVPVQENETEATKKAKYLYTSCINETLINEQDLNPLHEFRKKLGLWPVVDKDFKEEDFDVIDLMVRLKYYNSNIFLSQVVIPDARNSAVNIIQLDQTKLGMPAPEYYLKGRNNNYLLVYEKLAVDVAMMLNASQAVAEQDMKDMVDFEIQLANITIPDEKRRDYEKLYRKITIGELQEMIPGFDWLRYMKKVFSLVQINITKEEPVIIYAIEYLKNMVNIINNTSKRTLANYLMWRIMFHRINNLPKKYRNMQKEFRKVLYGKEEEIPRWRDCVICVKESMGDAVGRLFIQKYFDEQAKENAMEMIHNIRGAFNELLKEVEWMDDKTRANASEKANAIVERIGYPKCILNDTVLESSFKNLEILPDTFFKNILASNQIQTIFNLETLRKKVNRQEWQTSPAVINAFYSSTKNHILLPAAILQPPFYDKKYPNYLNYGGIGMVIGHELTHGFDDKGRQYDKDGNLKQWWDDDVIEMFKKKAQCIVEQYGNYTVPEVNVRLNGILTQSENIADNGGLKQAYRAYRTWVARKGDEKLLPGLTNLNQDQLFFLNFAQVWCGSERPEAAINQIITTKHSPGRFRVIGTLQNSKEFSNVFKCPSGSYMNPEKKCKVW